MNAIDPAVRAEVAAMPRDRREAWEERAAIMEHLGGMPREQAERSALRSMAGLVMGQGIPSRSPVPPVRAPAPLEPASRPGRPEGAPVVGRVRDEAPAGARAQQQAYTREPMPLGRWG